MREHGLRAMVDLKMRRFKYGKPSHAAPNHQQDFYVEEPDTAWTTDITYIRTHEGWLYLAVVMDLYSRRIIGWSMQDSLHRDLVIQALLTAIWKRRPKNRVLIHSDQGGQYDSGDWIRFCRDNGLKRSMSRRGNCWDNAAMESFFGSLKKERIRRKTYRGLGMKHGLMYSITLKHFTTGNVGISILEAFLRLNLKRVLLQARGVYRRLGVPE